MVETGGVFGQPAGKRSDCLKFLAGNILQTSARRAETVSQNLTQT